MNTIQKTRDEHYSNVENMKESLEYFQEIGTELAVKLAHEKDMIASRSLSAFIDHERVKKGEDYITFLTERRNQMWEIQELLEHIISEENTKRKKQQLEGETLDETIHPELSSANDPMMSSTLNETEKETVNILNDLKNARKHDEKPDSQSDLDEYWNFDATIPDIGEWRKSLCH